MRLLRYLLVIGAVVGAFLSASKPSSAVDGDDQTPPVCSVDSFAPSTIYPEDDGYRDTVSMGYSVSDDFAGDIRVQMWIIIPDGSGTIVAKDTEVLVPNGGSGSATWDGTYTESEAGPVGEMVPERLYAFTMQVTDGAGNVSNDCQRGVSVDHSFLTRKTFRATITAGDSQLEKLVGNCSILRSPSLRGWSESRGYYSNKRCERGFNPSRVATANGMLVPEAIQGKYHSLTVKTYGGAAKARPASLGSIQYLRKNVDADATNLRLLDPNVGTHAGDTVDNAGRFIRRDDNGSPYVAWLFVTVDGHQYDVRDFTVVLRYTGLSGQSSLRSAVSRPRVAGQPRLITAG